MQELDINLNTIALTAVLLNEELKTSGGIRTRNRVKWRWRRRRNTRKTRKNKTVEGILSNRLLR